MIRKSVRGVLTHVGPIAWAVICVVPFVLIVLLAFKSNRDIYSNPLGLTDVEWRPENFLEAWSGPAGGQGFGSYFVNSAIVAVAAIAGCLLLGSFTAYFASISSRRIRDLTVGACLVATAIPLIMLLIPYYAAFDALSLLSNPLMLGAVYAALCLPTCILILHSFYVGFPGELREAASLDGLGLLSTFTRIVLPLSKGPMVAVALINGIFIWGETQIAIVLLQEPASRTIPVGLLAFQGQFSTNTGAIFAGLTIATIPVVILYLVFQRSIAKGVALGGVFR